MKTMLSFVAVTSVLFFVTGLACAQETSGVSRVFLMDTSKSGPTVTQMPDVQWVKYDSLKTGIDSKGAHLATLYSVPNSNIQLAALKIEKGGYIALHTGPGTYPMYVAAGKGMATFKDGNKLEYKAGDVIVYMPNHY